MKDDKELIDELTCTLSAVTEALEQEKKKYNEALKSAKKFHSPESNNPNLKAVIEQIFPELRESEDERIRKEILSYFNSEDIANQYVTEERRKRWTAWLEKQKEEKHATIEQVYEKFLSSDTLKSAKENKYIRTQVFWELMHNGIITEVDYQYLTDDKRKPWTAEEYRIAYQKGFEMSEQLKQKEQNPVDDKAFEEWLDDWYQGSKEAGGDVVMSESEFKNWSRGIRNMYEQKPVEIHNPTDEEIESWRKELIEFKKFATKQAKENQLHISYTRDVMWENFCSELLSFVNSRKPAEWSEEDEDYMNAIIAIINRETALYPKGGATEDLNNDLIAWLKSLRSQLKQEWSEQDEKDIVHIIRILDECYAFGRHDLSKTDHDNLVGFLHKLKC